MLVQGTRGRQPVASHTHRVHTRMEHTLDPPHGALNQPYNKWSLNHLLLILSSCACCRGGSVKASIASRPVLRNKAGAVNEHCRVPTKPTRPNQFKRSALT